VFWGPGQEQRRLPSLEDGKITEELARRWSKWAAVSLKLVIPTELFQYKMKESIRSSLPTTDHQTHLSTSSTLETVHRVCTAGSTCKGLSSSATCCIKLSVHCRSLFLLMAVGILLHRDILGHSASCQLPTSGYDLHMH
jgi:hypothetical protein